MSAGNQGSGSINNMNSNDGTVSNLLQVTAITYDADRRSWSVFLPEDVSKPEAIGMF